MTSYLQSTGLILLSSYGDRFTLFSLASVIKKKNKKKKTVVHKAADQDRMCSAKPSVLYRENHTPDLVLLRRGLRCSTQ